MDKKKKMKSRALSRKIKKASISWFFSSLSPETGPDWTCCLCKESQKSAAHCISCHHPRPTYYKVGFDGVSRTIPTMGISVSVYEWPDFQPSDSSLTCMFCFACGLLCKEKEGCDQCKNNAKVKEIQQLRWMSSPLGVGETKQSKRKKEILAKQKRALVIRIEKQTKSLISQLNLKESKSTQKVEETKDNDGTDSNHGVLTGSIGLGIIESTGFIAPSTSVSYEGVPTDYSFDPSLPNFEEEILRYGSFWCPKCLQFNAESRLVPLFAGRNMQRLFCCSCGTEAPYGFWHCSSCGQRNALRHARPKEQLHHVCTECLRSTYDIQISYDHFFLNRETQDSWRFCSAKTIDIDDRRKLKEVFLLQKALGRGENRLQEKEFENKDRKLHDSAELSPSSLGIEAIDKTGMAVLDQEKDRAVSKYTCSDDPSRSQHFI
jgi:hypothetical protein